MDFRGTAMMPAQGQYVNQGGQPSAQQIINILQQRMGRLFPPGIPQPGEGAQSPMYTAMNSLLGGANPLAQVQSYLGALGGGMQAPRPDSMMPPVNSGTMPGQNPGTMYIPAGTTMTPQQQMASSILPAMPAQGNAYGSLLGGSPMQPSPMGSWGSALGKLKYPGADSGYKVMM